MDDLTPEEEANRERNLRRIAEGWAEHEVYTLELEELHRIVSPTPAQLRRIAELVSLLHGDTAALRHWKAAAEAGDEDAKGWLAEWDEEMKDPVVRALRERALAVQPSDQDILNNLRQYHADVEAIRKMKPEDFRDGL